MDQLIVPIPNEDVMTHAQILAYLGGLILSAFVGGMALRSKINTTFDNSMKGVKDEMSVLTTRVSTIEKNYVTHHETEDMQQKIKEFHDKDMDKMFSLVADIRNDLKEGFSDMSRRVDNFMSVVLSKSKLKE